MTDQSDRNKNWILKHYNKLKKNQLQCKYCQKLVAYNVLAKVHLRRGHDIDEDNNDDYIAKKRKNLIWEYFKEEEKYEATCNICNKNFLSGYNLENLERHLIKKHKETIERLQTIIRMTWIGQHYKFITNYIKITCKICNCVEINIYCIYDIIQHIELFHNINVENVEDTLANIRNAINESIKNAPSTSPTHLQEESEDVYTTPYNINDYDMDLLGQENAPSTSTQLQAKESEDKSNWNKSWISKYSSKLQPSKFDCNFCAKSFYTIFDAKVHLHHDHKIDEDDNIDEDNYIAKKQKNLIWQYYREEEKYAPTCNICNKKFLLSGYRVINLEDHLIRKHKETIERLQNIIRDTWIGQHYKFTWESYKNITCKICTDSKKINIYHISDVIYHLLRQHNINGEIQNTLANIKNAINESIKDAPSTSQTHLQEESEDVPPKKKRKY